MARTKRLGVNPMTQELATKLRDRNYPQPTYKEVMKRSKHGAVYFKSSQAYGPPIHELVEELIKVGEFHSLDMKGPQLWIAEAVSGKRASGSSTVEALANLWCALNKEKLKRRNISASARL